MAVVILVVDGEGENFNAPLVDVGAGMDGGEDNPNEANDVAIFEEDKEDEEAIFDVATEPDKPPNFGAGKPGDANAICPTKGWWRAFFVTVRLRRIHYYNGKE